MARVTVRVQPGASRSELVRWDGGTLQLRLAARPVEGRANAAVVDLVAGLLGVPKSRVSIERGHRARVKVLLAEGLSDAEVGERLARAVERSGR